MMLSDGNILSGSDPALSRAVDRIDPFAPRPTGNLIADYGDHGGTLMVTAQNTAFGRLLFGTTGNAFHAEDWTTLVKAFMPVFLPIHGPVIFGAVVLIPLIVRLVTRPLRRLAGEAALVAPASLEHRLGEEGLGVELQSLVRAVNAALARIEQGFARQRLYAANAAHELRTPISILSLRVEQLPASDLKARLELDVARIQTLVEQLVAVVRLGQSHVAMDEPVEIVQLLRDLVADRAPVAYRAGHDIELDAGPVALPFRGNRQALFSALANVIDNAIRAEPSGGVVVVRFADDGWSKSWTTARAYGSKTAPSSLSLSGGAQRACRAPASASPSSKRSPAATGSTSALETRRAVARRSALPSARPPITCLGRWLQRRCSRFLPPQSEWRPLTPN